MTTQPAPTPSRPLPPGGGPMVAVFACAGVQPASAVYVSAPITTGARFVKWLEDGDPSDYRRLVVEENIRSATSTVNRARELFNSPIIDPTLLPDVEAWSQPDYHAFWLNVIAQFARSIVFVDGWEFSTGAVRELACGLEEGLELLTSDFTALSLRNARHLGETAVGVAGDIRELESLAAAWRDALAAIDAIASPISAASKL